MEPDPAHEFLLPPSFYERDTVTVARELLGCVLVSTVGGETTRGRIVETEAYLGALDPGSHAATKGVTKRNAVMYGPAGHAYVYFTYGNHFMLNVVTEPEGAAGAVLLRALEPLTGLDTMMRRRAVARRSANPLLVRDIANGPGKLTAALGIDLSLNGAPLDGSTGLSIFGPGARTAIAASGRIGLSSGHELELRFFLEGDANVSRGHTGPRVASRAGRSRRGL